MARREDRNGDRRVPASKSIFIDQADEGFGSAEAEGASGGSGSVGSASRFHILQPNRDLESNWEVDLAKKLEEYLLKICSGELVEDQDHGNLSVNFAEAALLLQGSIQVYSRKVEYLYTLVLHALEFISQKRQEHQENSPNQPDRIESNAVVDEDDEQFLGLDDVPEEPKTCLDGGPSRDDLLNHFVKPPANLLVLEGDCLDTSGDAGELESYLLSTCNFYGDFLLLDPCDAEAIHDFLKAKDVGKEHCASHRCSSKSKQQDHLFSSPAGRSGGSRRKSSVGKGQNVNLNETSANLDSEGDCHNEWSEPHVEHDPLDDHMHHRDEPDAGCAGAGDISDDDDDPWKPLNPHEHGNLKVKPFRKGKHFGRKLINSTKRPTITSEFPLAKLDGIISPEFAEALELCRNTQRKAQMPRSPPLYEKLRQSLVLDEPGICDVIGDFDDENNDNGGENDIPDFDQTDFNLPHDTYDTNTDPFTHEKKDDPSHFDKHKPFDHYDLGPNATLEDLCRSHLDTLLASIAETEKQTELATRVSTWKQRIEHTLDDQDSRLPFDIQLYGENVLDKLSSSGDSGGNMCFTDVVRGQEKHDVARTFSALLQLVNNGNVDLDKKQPKHESFCHTGESPFYVRLLDPSRSSGEMQVCTSKKRVKSPLRKGNSKTKPSTSRPASPVESPHQNGKFSIKLAKTSMILRTPEGKRRRRSRLTEEVGLQPTD